MNHYSSLLRHFADLRDGTHGQEPGAVERTRRGKERLFSDAVRLIDPYARLALAEMNSELLLGTGEITATGVRRVMGGRGGGEIGGGGGSGGAVGGVEARWELGWPEQRAAGLAPVLLHAVYGAGFHHPHLQGGTVGQWPLNVFTEEQAAAELPVLRGIAAAELHNLVFMRDYRIVPGVVGEGVG
ncbi:hypothetical protein [Streptodolium elevatio]|uniref:Uncharacterized protein n=1 Tax=Streptodolium elevatio TaxID=3157996 RepID=A0ABV3DV93_9ACTN